MGGSGRNSPCFKEDVISPGYTESTLNRYLIFCLSHYYKRIFFFLFWFDFSEDFYGPNLFIRLSPFQCVALIHF